MIQLALGLATDTDFTGGNMAMWAFLSIGAVALFGIFLPVSAWMDARRKEREAYYRAEAIRRVAEATGEGAAAAVQLMREDERLRQIKKIEGMKVGGLVNIGVGIGIGCLLWSIGGNQGSPYLVGLIPGLIGVALLVYALFMAAPIAAPEK